MTASIGFRAPTRHSIVREVLPLLADGLPEAEAWEGLYRDAGAPASKSPARIPASLQRFARDAAQRLLSESGPLSLAIGQWLTEPKPQVWFEAGAALAGERASVRLDRRSRMMYDATRIYLNGEAFQCAPRDAHVLRRLADQRHLSSTERAGSSRSTQQLLNQWAEAGWLHETG